MLLFYYKKLARRPAPTFEPAQDELTFTLVFEPVPTSDPTYILTFELTFINVLLKQLKESYIKQA